MQASKVFLLLVVGVVVTEARVTDVPLGECHMCEVTCFDDCTAKYDAEIIQAEKREYEAKQRMLRTNGGGHISARGLAGVSLDNLLQVDAVNATTKRQHTPFGWRQAAAQSSPSLGLEVEKADAFAKCLRRKKCRGHNLRQTPRIPTGDCSEFTAPKSKSLLALRAHQQAQTSCATSEDSACVMECFSENVNKDEAREVTGEITLPNSSPSADQGRSLLQKRDYPLKPIRLGSFSKVGMSLDFCFKSCLAVTCGCLGAPGFATINSLYKQIKRNEASGENVIDTKARSHYKPATPGQCGGTKKGTKGLFVKTASAGSGDQGWVEICTREMVQALYGPTYDKTDQTLEGCESGAVEDNKYGCNWDKRANKCLVGFFPVDVECNVKYLTDPTF